LRNCGGDKFRGDVELTGGGGAELEGGADKPLEDGGADKPFGGGGADEPVGVTGSSSESDSKKVAGISIYLETLLFPKYPFNVPLVVVWIGHGNGTLLSRLE